MSYYDGELKRHCLSRGFASDEALNELGELIKPEVIDKLMDEESYETFASEIEKRAHRFLSHSVRGDLSRFTGPNGMFLSISDYYSFSMFQDFGHPGSFSPFHFLCLPLLTFDFERMTYYDRLKFIWNFTDLLIQ